MGKSFLFYNIYFLSNDMNNSSFQNFSRLKLNPYVLLIIFFCGVTIFTILHFSSEENAGVISFILSVVIATGVMISAFVVSKRYYPDILSKIYLPLAFAYVSYVVAELMYYSFDIIFHIPSYPSIADVFFFAVYPLMMFFLLLNLKHFHTTYTPFEKFLIPTIPIVASTVYVVMSLSILSMEFNFDFYYGLIFVSAASTVLTFSILGALIFKQGMLGSVWLLLVVGILLNTVGDVWYYNLEIFGRLL